MGSGCGAQPAKEDKKDGERIIFTAKEQKTCC
jgi:hypothetical protein